MARHHARVYADRVRPRRRGGFERACAIVDDTLRKLCAHAHDAAAAPRADRHVAVGHADDQRTDIVQRPLPGARRILQTGMRVEAAHPMTEDDSRAGNRQAGPEQTAL